MIYCLSISATGRDHTTTKLSAFDYTASDDGAPAGVLVIRDAEVMTPSGVKLAVGSDYASADRNLSLSIFSEGEQFFTGMAHWNMVAPYFGLRLASGEFLHINFKKIEPSDATRNR